MTRLTRWTLSLAIAFAAGPIWAHEDHEHAAAGEQTLTGEVVDVVCYLSHGEQGLGAGHAGCAKKCIQGGLPVALKVHDQLSLAAMADHSPANTALADYAGKQVTVRGTLAERDGQHLVTISKIDKGS